MKRTLAVAVVAAVLSFCAAQGWAQEEEYDGGGGSATPAGEAGKPANAPADFQGSRYRAVEEQPVYMENLTVGTLTVTKGIRGYTATIYPRPSRGRPRARAKITVTRPTIAEVQSALVKTFKDAKVASKDDIEALQKHFDQSKKKLDGIEKKVDGVDRKITAVDNRLKSWFAMNMPLVIFMGFLTVVAVVAVFVAAAIARADE